MPNTVNTYTKYLLFVNILLETIFYELKLISLQNLIWFHALSHFVIEVVVGFQAYVKVRIWILIFQTMAYFSLIVDISQSLFLLQT